MTVPVTPAMTPPVISPATVTGRSGRESPSEDPDAPPPAISPAPARATPMITTLRAVGRAAPGDRRGPDVLARLRPTPREPAQPGDPPGGLRGRARGTAAALAGLEAEVPLGTLARLLDGRHATTGRPLISAVGSAGRAHTPEAPQLAGRRLSLAEAARVIGVDPSYLRRLATRTAVASAGTPRQSDDRHNAGVGCPERPGPSPPAVLRTGSPARSRPERSRRESGSPRTPRRDRPRVRRRTPPCRPPDGLNS